MCLQLLHMGLIINTTQPLPGPGPLGENIGKPYPASTASGLGCLWALVSRQVEGQPGRAGLTRELRAVMLEIPVREKLGVVITEALSSRLKSIPMALSLSSAHAHYCP